MNKQQIETILNKITFKPFGIDFKWRTLEKGDGFLIQCYAFIPDCENKENDLSEQRGGKHYISKYATDSEVYFKAWKACQDYITHEIHESFYVNHIRVFDPHLDFEDLLDKISRTKRTARDGSWYPDHIADTEISKYYD